MTQIPWAVRLIMLSKYIHARLCNCFLLFTLCTSLLFEHLCNSRFHIKKMIESCVFFEVKINMLLLLEKVSGESEQERIPTCMYLSKL
jgi:hypothetical protein